MVKFVIVLLVLLVAVLVIIDIFNTIEIANEIAKLKARWISAEESANKANKRIDELKRALNEQDISTDFIAVERLKEPKEVRPIDGSYTSNN